MSKSKEQMNTTDNEFSGDSGTNLLNEVYSEIFEEVITSIEKSDHQKNTKKHLGSPKSVIGNLSKTVHEQYDNIPHKKNTKKSLDSTKTVTIIEDLSTNEIEDIQTILDEQAHEQLRQVPDASKEHEYHKSLSKIYVQRSDSETADSLVDEINNDKKISEIQLDNNINKHGSELTEEVQRNLVENVSQNVSNHDFTDSLKNEITLDSRIQPHDKEIDKHDIEIDDVKARELNEKNSEIDGSDLTNEVQRNVAENVSKDVSNHDFTDSLKNEITLDSRIQPHDKEIDQYERQTDEVEVGELNDMIETFSEQIEAILLINEHVKKLDDSEIQEDDSSNKHGSELTEEVQRNVAENVSKNVSNHEFTDSLKNEITLNSRIQPHDKEIHQYEKQTDEVEVGELNDMIETFSEQIDAMLLINEDVKKLDNSEIQEDDSEFTEEVQRNLVENVSQNVSNHDFSDSLKNEITLDRSIQPQHEGIDQYEKQTDEVEAGELNDMIETFSEQIDKMLLINEHVKELADDSLIHEITKSKEVNTSKTNQVDNDLKTDEENLDYYFDEIIDKKLNSATETETLNEEKEENTNRKDEKNEEVNFNIDQKNLQEELDRDIDDKYSIMVQDSITTEKQEEKKSNKEDDAKLDQEKSTPEKYETKESSPIPIAIKTTVEEEKEIQKKEEPIPKAEIVSKNKDVPAKEEEEQVIQKKEEPSPIPKVEIEVLPKNEDIKTKEKEEKVIQKKEEPPSPIPKPEIEVLPKIEDVKTKEKEEQVIEEKKEPSPIPKAENVPPKSKEVETIVKEDQGIQKKEEPSPIPKVEIEVLPINKDVETKEKEEQVIEKKEEPSPTSKLENMETSTLNEFKESEIYRWKEEDLDTNKDQKELYFDVTTVLNDFIGRIPFDEVIDDNYDDLTVSLKEMLAMTEDELKEEDMEINVEQKEENSDINTIMNEHVGRIPFNEVRDDNFDDLTDSLKEKLAKSEDKLKEEDMEINSEQNEEYFLINSILNDHIDRIPLDEEKDDNYEDLTESLKENLDRSKDKLKEASNVASEDQNEFYFDITTILNDHVDTITINEAKDDNLTDILKAILANSEYERKEEDKKINVGEYEENSDINIILNDLVDKIPFTEELDDDFTKRLKDEIASDVKSPEISNEFQITEDIEEALDIEPEIITTDQIKTTPEESNTPKTMSIDKQLIDAIIDEELLKEDTLPDEEHKGDEKRDTENQKEDGTEFNIEAELTGVLLSEADKKGAEKSKTLIEEPKEKSDEQKNADEGLKEPPVLSEADKKEDEKSKTLIEKPKEKSDEQKIADDGEKETPADKLKSTPDEVEDNIETKTSDKIPKEISDNVETKTSDKTPKEISDNVETKTSEKTLKEISDEEEMEISDEKPKKMSDEKSKKMSDETAGYCIQDDVRFLKFIANLNKIDCTCNRAGNDFVLEDHGSDRHKKGCPSSLAPRDVESIKVIFLTKHLPICRRFLTANERQVLRNILKSAPYYQMEFFVRSSPYEIRCGGEELVKSHMLDERPFPKRDDQKDAPPKSKKAILDELKEVLNLETTGFDPNLGRFPAEEYKFGEKYADKERKRAIDINDHPYDYPTTSKGPVNKDVFDERLILNLLNDPQAWKYFTSICICDVIDSFEDECESCTDPAVEHLRALLMTRVPPEEQKASLAMVDRNLRYFDDLMKKRLRENIEQEREHMRILREGKRKKEALFVEILSYKSSHSKKPKREEELSLLVNEMFRELIRNNQEIGKELEGKMARDDALLERDVLNQLRRQVTRGDLKLDSQNYALFERHILKTLHNRTCRANDLIRSELEYELDRSNEASLRLFQEVLNQVGQHQQYEDISQYFKNLYPSPDKSPSLSEQFDSALHETMRPWAKTLYEEKLGSQTESSTSQTLSSLEEQRTSFSRKKRYRKSSEVSSEEIVDDFSFVKNDIPGEYIQSDESIGQIKKNVPDTTEVKEVRDANTQTSALYQSNQRPKSEPGPKQKSEFGRKPKSLSDTKQKSEIGPNQMSPTAPLDKEIDRLLATLWTDTDDRVGLIRALSNELRRYDLCEESPKEKALSTKQSYHDFKEEVGAKIRRIPVIEQNAVSPKRKTVSPNRKSKQTSGPDYRKRSNQSNILATENVMTLSDEEFRYIVIEMPTANQKLDVFHDSFYGTRKTLAEIRISSDSKQIRTDIEMKN